MFVSLAFQTNDIIIVTFFVQTYMYAGNKSKITCICMNGISWSFTPELISKDLTVSLKDLLMVAFVLKVSAEIPERVIE